MVDQAVPTQVLILDKAVAIDVAVLDYPFECLLQYRQQLGHLSTRNTGPPGIVQ